MRFFPCLTLLLIALKLCRVIAWPWLAVASPLLVMLAMTGVFYAVMTSADRRPRRRPF